MVHIGVHYKGYAMNVEPICFYVSSKLNTADSFLQELHSVLSRCAIQIPE